MGVIEKRPIIEWGYASFTLPGQTASGDMHIVKEFGNGALVGVIDGLGHGNDAAAAAQAAAKILGEHPHDSVISLLRTVHHGLRQTRGVVMSLASFNSDENTMTWLSVGNVEGVLLRANKDAMPRRELILMRGGVVGYHLPQPYASMHSIFPGDTLVFATDGIMNSFYDDLTLHETPKNLAERICTNYCKKNDDALVLVARYCNQRI